MCILFPAPIPCRQPPVKFSKFEVVDFRPNTARLGFWTDEGYRKQMLFKTPVRQAISNFLNTIYANHEGSGSLLIIIKRLWLYDTVYMKAPKEARLEKTKGRIDFRMEAFIQTNEGYIPFTYLDTVVISRASVLSIADTRMPELILAFMDKIVSTDESIARNRKSRFSIGELDSMNRKKFSYPMDTATVFNKGAYASVEEFRNNQPSIQNYEIQKDEKGNLALYLKDAEGKAYFSRTMWGFCDGKYSYAMMDGNLFPILPVSHSFYVWGSKEYQQTSVIVPFATPLIAIPGGAIAIYGLATVSESAKRKSRLFTLDVYSGEIY